MASSISSAAILRASAISFLMVGFRAIERAWKPCLLPAEAEGAWRGSGGERVDGRAEAAGKERQHPTRQIFSHFWWRLLVAPSLEHRNACNRNQAACRSPGRHTYPVALSIASMISFKEFAAALITPP